MKEVIGNATLYLGDCMQIISEIETVDAVITDPPYGINWKPRTNHQDQPWKDIIDFDIAQILIGKKHIIWGAQYHVKALPDSDAWLTWCKRPIDSDFSLDQRSYATTETAWSDFGKSKFFSHVWDGGKRAGKKDNRSFCHPSQKPIELMEWCVNLCDDCDIVFDPFMGSGTTGIAANNLGKSFIGIEKEKEYFDIACERIFSASQQQRLFA